MISWPPSPLALPLALLFDRFLGDPDWIWRRLPHPVAVTGRCIDRLERALNRAALPFSIRRRRGVAALSLMILIGGAAGGALEFLLSALPFGLVIDALLASVLLAQKSLMQHVAEVARRLDRDGLAGGRQAVAQIVGRDVTQLNEAGVARAAIESAAENFSDGVVAPALFYGLLGLPGLLVYKIVNTADSMIGNRSPRHEAFGWAAARFDDLLNYVPARVAAVLIVAAAVLRGIRSRDALSCAVRDGPLHKSPNAGWSEAAAAGALGLALGGPRRYGEIEVDGAWFNPEGRQAATSNDIRAAIRLIDTAWAILLALAVIIALLIAR